MSATTAPKRRSLTAKQEMFAQAYVVTRNLAKSARLAGYSEQSARYIGYELFHENPRVRDRIGELLCATDPYPLLVGRVPLSALERIRRDSVIRRRITQLLREDESPLLPSFVR